MKGIKLGNTPNSQKESLQKHFYEGVSQAVGNKLFGGKWPYGDASPAIT